jgi:3-hydroxyisobutyrate dehydrogenase-like beta-hydroxyacid dehydrogenase
VSFIEAARYMDKFGVSPDVLSSLTSYGVSQLERELQQVLTRIGDGEFSTDQATLNVYADAADAFAAGLNEQGNAPMIQTTARVLRQAVDAGLGNVDIAAVSTLQC